MRRGGMWLQCGEHGFGFGAVVRLDEADDDVNTLPGKTIGLGEHRIGLAASWRYSEIDMQPAADRRRCGS